ncbi:MAG: UDP-N-acetylmuramate dehydrogenase [Erysipelotrichaceae bacterium]
MKQIKEALRHYGEVDEHTSFHQRTSFHVGGSIPYVVHPFHADKLVGLLKFLKQEKIAYKVLGRGSNLLCSDEDYDGVVISLERHFSAISTNQEEMVVGAGASLIATSFLAMQHGLSGLEFASGIPGTVGGAIFMNAGAYKSDMAAVVSQVYVLRDGALEWIDASELCFTYRHSILKDVDWIVLAVKLRLVPGDPKAIEALMQSRKERRLASQPYAAKSAGSTFKNPEGHQAWELIEQLAYRGKRVGGAQVSEKHCNFIINADDASAQDLYDLMMEIQCAVLETYGVNLQLEVELFNWNT